ncbi:MAG: peptidoglycan/LPS O-acetylase OafA/YrhL [Arenicella sp.]
MLLFHLKIPGFSGGFVGVDIFFVISGYLITKNIYSDLDAGKFRFKDFYLRLIYRLLPALLVTIAVTLVASYFILTPEHFSRLGSTSVASVFSVSNFLFWSEADYFDDAKILKPLLHTWSLWVEEQFYLLWPLLLFLLYSKGKKVACFSILLLAMVSLMAAQGLLSQYTTLVFYWMPLRISEFAVGAVLVLCCYVPSATWRTSLAAVAGLGLMLVPIAMYSEQTAFPGVMALIPCVGKALLIRYGRASIVFPLLANALFRQLGKISYSLYLVHWPVIVLVSYWKLGGIGAKSLVIVVPFIFLLAWALHHQVEQRYRRTKASTKPLKKGLGVAFFAALISLLATSISVGNGWPWRYNARAHVVINATDGLSASSDSRSRLVSLHQSSFQDQENVARHYIIGDSFAEGTMLALKAAAPRLNLK